LNASWQSCAPKTGAGTAFTDDEYGNAIAACNTVFGTDYTKASYKAIGVCTTSGGVTPASNDICGTTAGQGGWNSTFCNMPCDGTAAACTDPTGQGQAMSCYTPPAGKC